MILMTLNIDTLKSEHIIKLTSAEIANLWTSYINDTLAICILDDFWHM